MFCKITAFYTLFVAFTMVGVTTCPWFEERFRKLTPENKRQIDYLAVFFFSIAVVLNLIVIAL